MLASSSVPARAFLLKVSPGRERCRRFPEKKTAFTDDPEAIASGEML
jgi:hypothetical protein